MGREVWKNLRVNAAHRCRRRCLGEGQQRVWLCTAATTAPSGRTRPLLQVDGTLMGGGQRSRTGDRAAHRSRCGRERQEHGQVEPDASRSKGSTVSGRIGDHAAGGQCLCWRRKTATHARCSCSLPPASTSPPGPLLGTARAGCNGHAPLSAGHHCWASDAAVSQVDRAHARGDVVELLVAACADISAKTNDGYGRWPGATNAPSDPAAGCAPDRLRSCVRPRTVARGWSSC